RIRSRTPTGRLATMADVAGATLFLLDNGSGNATNLNVDGGWLVLLARPLTARPLRKLVAEYTAKKVSPPSRWNGTMIDGTTENLSLKIRPTPRFRLPKLVLFDPTTNPLQTWT